MLLYKLDWYFHERCNALAPQLLSACALRSCVPAALTKADANGATPLHVAAHCGNASAIDALLSSAHHHSLSEFATAVEGSGKSALWLAAAAGHSAAVQCLLKVVSVHTHKPC
jgi:ankyrin repeat protein